MFESTHKHFSIVTENVCFYRHTYVCKTTKKQQLTDSSSLYKFSCEPVRFTRLMVLRVLKLDSLIDIFMTGISFSLLI